MPRRKGISIKDVARESQASLTTVSLVLNNRDGRISPATRERVLKTVDRLGYRPSRLAQGLQAQRSGCLAILVRQLRHAFADVYFGELISAIHDFASGAGYKILLEVAHPDFIQRRQHLELFDRHFVDGLLALGVTTFDEYLADFEDGSRAVLIVNNYLSGKKLNHVKCDYHQAGWIAAEYLSRLGHRNIGLIHGAPEVQTTSDLRSGFEEGLTAAGISLPKHRTADGLYTEEGGATAAAELIQRERDLTAILAGNDKMAIGAMSAIKALGRRVPEDISVLGCDDLRGAEFCDPPLTTIHTPLYEVGQRACERLLALVEGKVETVEETQPVSLIVRKSTAPPK
ncbi:MAG TPA: LacI family DNA-binding transcriptional regulator [Phycisphaerae bacterium]|nr:LacI family DNA-binding transcriptional regulator [Phycisphaerae bacterium]